MHPSREQMRQARLRAFESLSTSSDGPSAQPEVPSSKSVAGQEEDRDEHQEKKRIITSFVDGGTFQPDVQDLMALLYVGGEATEEDARRWGAEGFTFYEQPWFGLKQRHGGPCGVLAV
eukprot:gene47620-58334_t